MNMKLKEMCRGEGVEFFEPSVDRAMLDTRGLHLILKGTSQSS